MSTKIYNGMRAVGTTDPFAVARHVRRVCTPVYFDLIWSAVSDHMRELVETGKPFAKYLLEVLNRIDELDASTQRTFDPLDVKYKVALLSGPDQPLLNVFGENPRPYLNALLQSGIEDYGYWDNSDRPEELTQAQWDKRRDDWGIALAVDPEDPRSERFALSPSEAGLVIEAPTYYQAIAELMARARGLMDLQQNAQLPEKTP